MKKITVLFLLLIFMLTACKQPDFDQKSTSENITADVLYDEFLSKKINAVDKNGEAITFESYLDGLPENAWRKYAIYDMNGDSIPELIIKTGRSFDIFWIKNDIVTLWYQGTNYTKPLNNMALLSEREGAAPEHTDYIYYVLGYQGEEVLKIEFSKCSASEFQGVQYDEIYLINNTEVTEQIYNSLTEPLLTVSDDKITWKELP